MKRIISFCLTLIICVYCVPCAVFAQRDVSHEERLAQELRELGLFRGVSDTDFDLDRAPSRVEAVVMLIRVLGRENEVTSGVWRHPFTDVPEWANKYVGFAYSNGLTNGQSLTEFGTGDANAAMFITFVLRALGYSDAGGADFVWNDPFTLARTVGIIPDGVNVEEFWRSDVVLVAHASLAAYLKGTNQTLAQKLIAAGVFTQEKFNLYYGKSGNNAIKQPALTELTAEQIYATCSPAVFYIEIYDGLGKAVSAGSGFFIDDKGTAVTNYHVIEGASYAKVQTSDSGAVYDITGVYDYSVENDWAVIKVNCTGNKYLTVGDASTVVGAATVYAIGSPLGLQNTISQGLISNPTRVQNGTTYIQISAAISHGSSGGALINKYGEVIGITSAGFADGQNLNLAIPMTLLENASREKLSTLGEVNYGAVAQSPGRTEKAISFLKSFVLGNYNSESSLGKGYTHTGSYASGEEYTLYYNESDGTIGVSVYLKYNSSMHLMFYLKFYPEKNIAYTKYTYKRYSGLSLLGSTEGSANIVCSTFRDYTDYKFSQYNGTFSERSDDTALAGAMMCGALNFINGMFSEYLGADTGFSVADLGFAAY